MHSEPGEYHGFFWFYFINEHLLRFLNLRYPRDYNTVPRVYFWLFHLLWLFPWSVYFPAVAKLSFRPVGPAPAARACWPVLDRLQCWCSSPFRRRRSITRCRCYPALALLLGSAMAGGHGWLEWSTRHSGC